MADTKTDAKDFNTVFDVNAMINNFMKKNTPTKQKDERNLISVDILINYLKKHSDCFKKYNHKDVVDVIKYKLKDMTKNKNSKKLGFTPEIGFTPVRIVPVILMVLNHKDPKKAKSFKYTIMTKNVFDKERHLKKYQGDKFIKGNYLILSKERRNNIVLQYRVNNQYSMWYHDLSDTIGEILTPIFKHSLHDKKNVNKSIDYLHKRVNKIINNKIKALKKKYNY